MDSPSLLLYDTDLPDALGIWPVSMSADDTIMSLSKNNLPEMRPT